MLNRKELFHRDLSNESLNQANNSRNNENNSSNGPYGNSSSGNSSNSVSVIHTLTYFGGWFDFNKSC